jgi:hypothetical protein
MTFITENRLMNLHLVHHNLTHAIMYNPDGEVQVPSELLYKKNILVIECLASHDIHFFVNNF